MMARLFLNFLQCKVVIPPLDVWMVWIWNLMVILGVKAITLVWVTSLLVWNFERCFVLEILFVPMKHVHTRSSMGSKIERYWKGHTTKPLLFDSIVLDETYTCIFCKNLTFCEFRCGACMFDYCYWSPSSLDV